MEFEIEQQNGFILIRIKGMINGGPGTAELRGFIFERLDEGCRVFVFNLAKATWANSVGLGALIEMQTAVKNAGGSLAYCSAGCIDAILSATHLRSIFKVYETEAAALEASQKKDQPKADPFSLTQAIAQCKLRSKDTEH